MRKRFSVLAAFLAACCLGLAGRLALADPPQAKLFTRCHHVADLVVPVAKEPAAQTCEGPQGPEERLIELITRTIKPDSWSDRGGPGTIEYYPLTMSLVINQTADVQGQVQDLLAALRRQQDVEVALEVRVVTISEDFFEQIGANFERDTTQKDHLGLQFLDDKQVHQLMQAAQGDSRTSVMQAPKMTLLNGQSGTINVTDAQNFLTGVDVVRSRGLVTFNPKIETITTGFRMTAQPVVSADRRFVQVSLKIDQSDVASPVPTIPMKIPVETSKGETQTFTQCVQQPRLSTMAVETTVTIPDGGTVLFGGLKKVSETRQEISPPTLSKVPYVNRLFRNVAYGKDTYSVLFLVTPRIIINEQEEPKAATQAAPAACRERKHWGRVGGYVGGCPFLAARAAWAMQARSKCAEASCPLAAPPAKAAPACGESKECNRDNAYSSCNGAVLSSAPAAPAPPRIVIKAAEACSAAVDSSLPPRVDGVVAGKVLTKGSNQGLKMAQIEVVDLDKGRKAPEAPIFSETDPDGFFYVRGLEKGKHYQLIARARDGQRILAGAELVTPPNIHVCIMLTEDRNPASDVPLGPGPLPGQAPEPAAQEPSAKPYARIVAKLLKAYDRACEEGQTEEAKKLAKALLSLDPTCFHGKR